MSLETFLTDLGTTLETEAKTELGTFLTTFTGTNLGKMATAAVQYAEGAVEGASGEEKMEAAKTELLNLAGDEAAALVDLGESFLRFTLETALQAVEAEVPAAIAAAI